MKVNLIKEAEYELTESKYTQIDFNVFCKLANVNKNSDDGEVEKLPDVMLFNNIDDFRKSYEENSGDEMFDTAKKVHIMSNGNVLVFLNTEEVTVNTDKDAITTDTQENKGK